MRRRILGRTGPFVTWVVDRDRRGRHLLRTSRRQRKALPALPVADPTTPPLEASRDRRPDWARLWAPSRSQWWIGVLFMVGAALFAIGSGGGAWLAPRTASWTFAIGAVFFTAAAYLQWLEALNNDLTGRRRSHRSWAHGWRLFGWRGRSLGYQSGLVQLVGTLLFNLNTIDALVAGPSPLVGNLAVWTPNMLGSVCFLAASQLAIMEVSHGPASLAPRNVSWWITEINMLGSIFFMVSAVASFVEPRGQLLWPLIATGGTFLGALCFFAGAYLLIPEMFEKAEARGG